MADADAKESQDNTKPGLHAMILKHNTKALPPFSSPLRRRVNRPILTSMESLASDISTDISDITMEIDKISRDRDDPEQGMKETNRLLKEIDHQMEISFEVMEERQNMVREFLKERDKAERQHRRRATDKMSQFSDKFSAMEDALGYKVINTKDHKTSITQTEKIETCNTAQQTTNEEISENNLSVKDTVKAFTKEMKEILEKHLITEQLTVIQELEAGRNKQSTNEVDELLCDMQSRYQRKKAGKLLDELLREEDDSQKRKTLLQKKEVLIEWMLDTNDCMQIIRAFDEKLQRELLEIKSKLHEVANLKDAANTLGLKKTCRKIDLLEASLDSILKDIQKNLDLNDEDLEDIAENIITNEHQKPDYVIAEVVQKDGKEITDEKFEEAKKSLETFVKAKREKTLAENELHEIFVSQVVTTTEQARDVIFALNEKNKELLSQKENTCTKYLTSNDEVSCITTHVEPVFVSGRIEQENAITLNKPKLEKAIVHDHLHLDASTQPQTIDLVYYLEKPINETLEQYEQELENLRDTCSEGQVYREIENIIAQNHNDIIPALTAERVQIASSLNAHLPEQEVVQNKLQLLRQEKDELIAKEKKLIKTHENLTAKLHEINQSVADKVMSEEKKEEKRRIEQQISHISDEITNMQQKICDSDKTRNSNEIKEQLSDKIYSLRADLQKISLFVNKNSNKYNPVGFPEKPPHPDQIKKVLDTRNELSKKLTETENKIQDIITSQDYESSDAESLEDMEGMKPLSGVSKEIQSESLKIKLVELEKELDVVNQDMMTRGITTEELNQLTKSSETLKKALTEIEENLQGNDRPSHNELASMHNQIKRMKNKLAQSSITNFEYDGDNERLLKNLKLKYEGDMEAIIESLVENDRQSLRQSKKYYLKEQDYTKQNIMHLEDDVLNLSALKTCMANGETINDQFRNVQRSIVEKKADSVSKTIYFVEKKLGMYADMLESKMRQGMEELEKNNGDTKQYMSLSEKRKLALELKAINEEIKHTETDINGIEECRVDGENLKGSHFFVKEFAQKKNIIVSTLEEIDNLIENSSDTEKLKDLLDKKVEMKQQLIDLEERVENQSHILKEHLSELMDIKNALENKMVNAISIEDFMAVISTFSETSDGNGGESCDKVYNLMKTRKELHDNVLEMLAKDEIMEADDYCNRLEIIDANIYAEINEIVRQQQELDIAEALPFSVLGNPNNIRELIQARADLANALTHTELVGDTIEEDFNEDDLKQIFEDLTKMEHEQRIVKNFRDRNIELSDLNDVTELNELNEEKLDIIQQKVICLNNLFDAEEEKETDGKSGLNRIVEKADRINVELNNATNSYVQESLSNSYLLQHKPYVREMQVKQTNLDNFLKRRDEELSKMFSIEHQLSCSKLEEARKSELLERKEIVQKNIEDIEKRIIDAEFKNQDDSHLGPPNRSFSPRSTSSRNSVRIILDDRDKLLKKIFKLQKREQFLKESGDIINKQSAIGAIQNKKYHIHEKLHVLDEKLNHTAPTQDTLVEENDNESDTTNVLWINEAQLKGRIQSLREELRQMKNEDDFGTVQLKDLSLNPQQVKVIKNIQEIEKKLDIECTKKNISDLNGKKEEIDDLSKNLKEKKKSFENVNKHIEIINKKLTLEKTAIELKSQLVECESANLKGSTQNENGSSKVQLKREKRELEKSLDEINITINQYANGLENDINKMEAKIQEMDIESAKKMNYADQLEALLSHRKELEKRLSRLDKSLFSCANGSSLPDLLLQRRKIIHDIEDVRRQIEDQNIHTKKQAVRKELHLYFHQNKKIQQDRQFLQTKLRVLEEKLKSHKTAVPDVAVDGNLRDQLGENLYNVLTGHEEPREKYLKDVSLCLEERTLSQYIKDVLTLCDAQNEQIENLKEDIKSKKLIEVSETPIKSLTEQINQLENELISSQEQIGSALDERSRVREKLGNELYIFLEDASSDAPQVKDGVVFEKLSLLLNDEYETVQNLLTHFLTKSQIDEKNKQTVVQLAEEVKMLQKRLAERDEQLKQREDGFHSETESLRDNLHHCVRKTSAINEEASKLRDDYGNAMTLLDSARQENTHLQGIIDEGTDLRALNNKLKVDLLSSNGELEKLKQTKSGVQNELESIRKKWKRVNQEKITWQENLEKKTKVGAQLEEELNNMKQKEKFSKHEMHKNCQLIEKQERELKRTKVATSSLDKQNADLQNTVLEVKEKYQALTTKCQNESARTSKELRATKNKIEEQRNEIEKLNHEIENSTKEVLHVNADLERNRYSAQVKELNTKIRNINKEHEGEIADLQNKITSMKHVNDGLESENHELQKKLNELDESFETELSDTKKQLNEKHRKAIDDVNKKLRSLTNDVMLLQKIKVDLEEDNRVLQNETSSLQQKRADIELMADEKEKSNRVKYLGVTSELEALKLENIELNDEVFELKNQIKKVKNLDKSEQELLEGTFKLKMAAEQLEEEKRQFEEHCHNYMKQTINEDNSVSKSLDDRVPLKLLKTSQEERDKLSNDLLKVNRELVVTRNELRKLKSILRQKDEEFASEQHEMMTNFEAKQKQRVEEIQRSHKKEKEELMKLYNEERNKWEDEMKSIQYTLQEENMKQLNEQRADFEKDLHQHLQKYLKQSQDEIDELLDKVNVMKNEKVDLIKQFDSEKALMKKKQESERFALEETIRGLLDNIMKNKQMRNRMKTDHQDEINELEERFDYEREKLEERREQDVQALKVKVRKSFMLGGKEILQATLEEIINEMALNKYGPIRTRPEKECDANETNTDLSLGDLRDLVHMGDLKDILSSEYDTEKDMIKESMREQYKARLRQETDALMTRLLELSEEMDSLRVHT